MFCFVHVAYPQLHSQKDRLQLFPLRKVLSSSSRSSCICAIWPFFFDPTPLLSRVANTENIVFAVNESGRRKGVTRGVIYEGKDFSGQDLTNSNFQTSLMRGANFSNAKLKGANFFDADLSTSNLEGADLTGAVLEVTNMRNVNLKNAILTGAFMSGNTKLEGADITGADFSGILLRKDLQEYLCSIADGVNSTTGVSTRESLECE
mmetsp:Transcript_21667/g.35855  ORF Transcript_21667/g.35855 Transcript_21667/m.35855 type:complete len:206 (-) Transcript_21667:228-845(-)|eukprot:CAMPEP_0184656502 /NCGR_PEP_ID=MMETSP0308-20130426/16553_1 /TAXON_ID=38269 /ORGANISM="Gloeochaete witrockiana, Strain SAG 46.84" /LENGTH=205 /DNA_ID=CAMNT_0027093665 /DNA_START=45 /DNA_END=662 /DNA_ORIENTATION=+